MLRYSLPTIAVFAVLAAVDALAWVQLAGGSRFEFPGAISAAIHPGNALPVHGLTALAATLLGAFSLRAASWFTRFTMALFLFVLTLILPVLGILLTAALTLILRQSSTGGIRPEERFVFGNPGATAARRRIPAASPTLTPLAEGFRSMDEETLCQAILGLKHLKPVSAILPFLQRFQQDPRTSVQFTAQAVLGGAVESYEDSLRTLRQRLTHSPRCPETRLAMADTLAMLAAWSPPGDPTSSIRRREARMLLEEPSSALPADSRSLRILAQLQLANSEGSSAEFTATALAEMDSGGDSAAQLALLESLYHQARWDDLAAAARLVSPPPGMMEPVDYWATSPR